MTRAVGLEVRDLFPTANGNGNGKRQIVATYPYRDESGRLLFESVRYAPKDFAQRRPDGAGGWLWKLGDVRRVLYRLPELQGQERVFVCEGEKDCDRLATLGLPATTNAGGAGKWRSEYADQLKAAGCLRVVILPDNDTPGDEHGRKVAASCRAAGLGVKVVQLPGVPAKGDVSDYLENHSAADLQACVEAAGEAVEASGPAVAPVAPVAAVTAGERLASQLVDDVSLLSRPAPPWQADGRFLANTLVLLFGPAGAGKTFTTLLLAFCLAARRPWLGADITTGGPVVYVAGEGVGGLGARVRAVKLALGLPLDELAGVYILPQAVDLMTESSVTALLEATDGINPAAFVFDTLARNMVGDDSSAADMGRVIASLDRIGRETGATRIPLHHSTKAGGVERGSTALRAGCDTVLALSQADDLLTLTCEKQKDAEPFEPLALRLVPVPETSSCVVRLASEVLSGSGLTPGQFRALTALRESFDLDGATAAEWDAAMPEVPERSRFRARKMLMSGGYVAKRGQRFAWTGRLPDAPK